MQRTNKKHIFAIAAFLVMGAFAHAETAVTGQQHSVKTVDDLLKIDNAVSLVKAKRDAAAAGVIDPSVAPKADKAAATKPAASQMNVRVDWITGVRDDLVVKMTVDGQAMSGLKVGSAVKGCVISSIQGVCVALSPPPSDTTAKGKSKKVSHGKLSCPTACWTGVAPIVTQSPVGMPSSQPMPGGVMPSPVPVKAQ